MHTVCLTVVHGRRKAAFLQCSDRHVLHAVVRHGRRLPLLVLYLVPFVEPLPLGDGASQQLTSGS